MSRCFPFPPPGYEKKTRTDETDLLTKEKHNEKKHKKDKKDKEKREGKEKKDKERSKEKHKEKKERKEKHKDRKDKAKGKEKNQTLDDKKVEVLPAYRNGEKLAPNILENNGIGDFKYVQELARRIRDEDAATGSHIVQKIKVTDQRRAELPGRMVESNIGNPSEKKEKPRDKKDDERKINGQRNDAVARSMEDVVVKKFSGMDQKRVEAIARPMEKNDVGKQMEGKESYKHKESDKKGEKPKDKDRKKKSKSKEHKEKKKEEKTKEITEPRKELPKLKEDGATLMESGKESLDVCNAKPPDLLKTSSKSSAEGNLGKRKALEINGFLHEGESSLEQGFTRLLSSSSLISDDLSMKVEDEAKNGHNNLVFVESNEEGLKHSAAASLEMEFDCRKRLNVYREIMQSYDKLCLRHESLIIAKTKILSYTPGAWVEKVGGMKLSHYDVPKTTSLLLIGPKGSGKSSLVNRISKVFEDDMFASDRAQVSYNSSSLDGTYFLKEYMIPRGSTSFCLYDTRSLGYSSSDNMNMVKHWITKGVRHGEVVVCKSDSPILRDGLQCKARRYNCRSSEIRMVNFVVFVVNGLEILKSLDSNGGGETCYTQMIASAFNCPYLSFRDDKPAVVFTHGDLLSLDDRVRIRIHLGELLGIPPAKQIFDIPESCDPGTELTILDMLRYSLEHADSNLPPKGCIMNKVHRQSRKAFLFLLIILWFAILSGFIQVYKHKSYKSDHVDWHAIRHLWSE